MKPVHKPLLKEGFLGLIAWGLILSISALAPHEAATGEEGQKHEEHKKNEHSKDEHKKVEVHKEGADQSASSKDAHLKENPPQSVGVRRSQFGCLVDEAAVEDLQKAREEVASKQKMLSQKEDELKAQERSIAEEMKKLQEARDEFSKFQNIKKKEDEEKIAKLVETFLNMSPRSASKVISTLDDSLAVAVLSKMDTQPLARIMNVLDPKRSSSLSEMMVGMRGTRKNIPTPPVTQAVASPKQAAQLNPVSAKPVPENSIEKGGGKNDGHNELNGSKEHRQQADGSQSSAEKDKKATGA